jgi:hypothetical protein
VHAGLLTFASGGQVIVEMIPGQDSYVGSDRNGVTSRDYTAWGLSFRFIGSDGLPASTSQPTSGPAEGTPSTSLTGAAADLLEHVPVAFQGTCSEVTSFDAGVVVAIQCINIPDVDGYVSYYLFDNDTNQFAAFTSNFEFYGDPDGGLDCASEASLVAHERGGIVEGRLFCNEAPQLEPDALIDYWFDTGRLVSATMRTYGSTYADTYALYLTAGPTE